MSLKDQLILCRVIMVLLAIGGLSLPAQIWGTLSLSKEPAPFQEMAFSAPVEITIGAFLSSLAFVTAFLMWRRSNHAIKTAMMLFCIGWVNEIVESVLTFGTKKYFPGPRAACIASPILGLVVVCVMSWYFLKLYPKLAKEA